MTTWNVVVLVIDLIDADTGEEARAQLRDALLAAGFDTYDDITDPTAVNLLPLEAD
jgi:hypothetical protein